MINFNFAKIIATIGPSLCKETILTKIINSVDIFRINFSYGDESLHRKYIESIKKIDASKTILLDLKGPKIRVQNLNIFDLKQGDQISIYSNKETSEFNSDDKIFIDFSKISEIPETAKIIIPECDVELKIIKKRGDNLLCEVLKSGIITPYKIVTFSNYNPQLPFLAEIDKNYIKWGIANGVSIFALSYIQNTDNILEIKDYLKSINKSYCKLIVKIQTKESLDDIENIIKNSDGIIIARKSLHEVISLEELPAIQLKLIDWANRLGKPIILANDILQSIELNIQPSSAELNEIVFDIIYGVDCFLLSNETATSKYPIETINWLYKAITANQTLVKKDYKFSELNYLPEKYITDYIIYTAYKISKQLDIKVILCPTKGGYTPARLSTMKPNIPIIVFTEDNDTYKYLNLLRGVKGFRISNLLDYENVKKIGKEMIRVMFKGNISLDDNILIVHSANILEDNNIINGIEIYKFKDL